MNTTEVLKCAYPANARQDRYGGPIRNSDEMFRYYKDFYHAPMAPLPDRLYPGLEVNALKTFSNQSL